MHMDIDLYMDFVPFWLTLLRVHTWSLALLPTGPFLSRILVANRPYTYDSQVCLHNVPRFPSAVSIFAYTQSAPHACLVILLIHCMCIPISLSKPTAIIHNFICTYIPIYASAYTLSWSYITHNSLLLECIYSCMHQYKACFSYHMYAHLCNF